MRPDDTDAWLNTLGELVHPNAPRGGSGPGPSRFPGSYGANPSANAYGVPHPVSPSARYLAVNDVADRVVSATDDSAADARISDEELGREIGDAAEDLVGKPSVGKQKTCFDLPDQVLTKSGAKSADDIETVTGKDDQDYKWGRLVDSNDDVRRGDIVQFRNHTQTVKTTLKNKQSQTETSTRGPQHSAIVLGKNADGSVDIAEQHVFDRKTKKLSKVVKRAKLYLDSKTIENPDGSTIDVKTSGSARFYHPVVNKKAKIPKFPR